MEIKTAFLTDCGGKAVNDDTVQILHEEGLYVFVGDGLGGYAGGQLASQLAAEIVLSVASRERVTCGTTLQIAAEAAHAAVRQLQQAKNGNMKTTCVFLAIEGDVSRWMHIGDSRLYHFRQGKLISQTKDHSVSQLAVMMGEITPEQIRFHEDRNRVLRALGAENAKPAISAELKTSAGDAFLLCTDGFWEYVYEEEMEQLLQNTNDPQQWLKDMEVLLRKRIPAGADNYTAAAVIVVG